MFSKRDRRGHWAWVVMLAGLGLLTLLPGSTSVAQPNPDLQGMALERVAERHGVPVNALAVLNSAVAEYPLLGRVAWEWKIVDNRSGAIYGVSLDETGRELDRSQLEAVEGAALAARYGRIEPALAARLAAAEEASIEVMIWLKEPSYSGPERPDPKGGSALATQAEVDAFLAQVDARRAAAVQAVVAPLAERLAGLGYYAGTGSTAPLLVASLPPEAIRDVAGWDEVDMVYQSLLSRPLLEVARPTILADIVHGRGYTGSGVKLAQVEVGGRIATGNPYLSGVTQDPTYVCASPSSHSTGVAGIVRSTHSSRKGIAFAATYWAGGSCSGSSSELQNRTTAAKDWGARAINLSFGYDAGLVPGANERFYDGMVINNYRSIVVAAGNSASACAAGSGGNVFSPGLAYNVVTVGNFDDKNTSPWSDDAMRASSSWRDPASTHSDREKPEVAGPGTNINSTTTSLPWTGAIGSGTSFAAPMVTGVSGLLMQRSTGLQTWPEAVKAILMTTAMHNIEGSGRLSECDGAGGVAADRADDLAHGVNGNWGAQSYSCSTATPLDVASMSLTGGTRTRATIAWDTDPSYGSYAAQPGADLDLQVINSSGTVVASSSSFDNTYEIVDFTPSSSGAYKLRVVRYRCDFSPRWLGWAWRKGN